MPPRTLRDEVGADPEGFVPRAQLKSILRVRGVQALGGTPGLVVDVGVGPAITTPEPDDLSFKKTLEGASTDHGTTRSFTGLGLERYRDQVALLTKRSGNPFPNMITVGRAANCDLRVVLGTVSKVQAYFLCEQGTWAIVDQRSKNGTFVDGRQLGPGEKAALNDGAALRLGSDFAVTFCLPERLAQALGV
jgi:hypothetical protein